MPCSNPRVKELFFEEVGLVIGDQMFQIAAA
jgi:hypothetical protein